MTPQPLLELLDAVLRGDAPLDVLLDDLAAASEEAPHAAEAFLREIEQIYARNEIHFDLYLRLKDQVQVRPSRTTRPPVNASGEATVFRSSTRSVPRESAPPAADRTMLRSHAEAAPSQTVRSDPGATVGEARRPSGPSQPKSRPPMSSRPPPDPRTAGRTGPGTDSGETQTWITEQPLESGSVIKDRFVLEKRLGEGGMGVVFKARDLRKEEARDRDPFVAIKFLSSEFRRHPEALMALQRESRRAQALAHPNVVTVHDFDRDGTLIYMTMEFLEGEPLDRFIQRRPQGLRLKEAWPIIEGCSRALAYAHQEGVVHADFKPGNVFVAGQRKVKVLDFGIARAVTRQGDERVTGTRFDAGSLGALTPAYASPEMLLNEKPDPRDDVYALACVVYELLTGRHPFSGAPAVKAAHEGMTVKRTPGLGRRQHRALSRGLAFRQSDRTPTVEEFLDELAGPLGARGRALRQLMLSTTGTGILVAALAASAWWFTRANPDEQLQRQLMDDARTQVEETRRQTGEAPVVDKELRDILLEQGRDYLQLSADKVDPVILSEGVSSAYGAFTNALKIDPTSTVAAQGVVEIVRIYENEARRQLEAGNSAKASELAGYALKIHPTRESLIEIKNKADEQLGRAR